MSLAARFRDTALRRTPSLAETVADGCVHVVGVVAGLIGAALLLVATARRGQAHAFAAVSVYASGLIAMLAASAAYNLTPPTLRIKAWLRRLDHSAIFLMIAGTYTPFTTLALDGHWAIGLTAVVWAVAITGIGLKCACPHRFERSSIGLYIVLGWLIVVAAEPLFGALSPSTIALLGAGGLVYTTGVIFHLWERLPFQTAIWHLFVLVAATLHYVAVLDGIVLA